MSTEKKQVVEKVIFFSSQYGSDKSKSYTAENLAGNSYNYPNYGDFTQAFVLRSYGPWWEMSPSFRDPIDKSRRKLISEDFVDLAKPKTVELAFFFPHISSTKLKLLLLEIMSELFSTASASATTFSLNAKLYEERRTFGMMIDYDNFERERLFEIGF
ncbi:F-box/LRR-repeat protein 4 [Stylophora pistillata]|uniref:F-box/LRR-repeat protein 4 n=1 Tax=Stylophora pistillata TaxID=50429 RepID=A0A2B4S813_STYPI|nr:F-box/LRR-repeat protein 4 [Stylophora pistillata]